MCLHAYVHTYTYMHTYIHTYILAYILAYIMHTYVCVCLWTKGGQSVWKKPFKDEFKPNLAHNGM